MPDASYPKPISVPTDPSRTSQGASSVGGVEKYGMIDAEGLPGDAININASLITRGTLSGRNVQSTSGGDRIILNNGNYLQFFRGGRLHTNPRLLFIFREVGGLKRRTNLSPATAINGSTAVDQLIPGNSGYGREAQTETHPVAAKVRQSMPKCLI